jgi:hypothetical protein
MPQASDSTLTPATHFDQVGPYKPFFPQAEGQWSTVSATDGQPVVDGQRKKTVALKIGLPNEDALFRLCEQRTEHRRRAASLFITSSAQQVGRAAIWGWRELIGPFLKHRELVRIWPFDGSLQELVSQGGVTVCESYPGETYGHLGISGATDKTRRTWRSAAGRRILDVLRDMPGLVLRDDLVALIDEGFGDDELGEDRFDAVVGLLGMVLVALGHDSAPVPDDRRVRIFEGWIVGA